MIDHSPAQVLDYGKEHARVRNNDRLTLSDYLDTYKNPAPYHISLMHRKIFLMSDPRTIEFKAHDLSGSFFDKVTTFSSVYLNEHIYVIGGQYNDLLAAKVKVEGKDYSKTVDQVLCINNRFEVERKPGLISRRCAPVLATIGYRWILAIGGLLNYNPHLKSKAVECYDSTHSLWFRCRDLPEARSQTSAVVLLQRYVYLL